MAKKLIGDINRGYALVDDVYAENIEMMEKIERVIKDKDFDMLSGFDFKKATAKKVRHDDATGATGIFWDNGGDTVVAVMALPREFAEKMMLEDGKEIGDGTD